MSRQEVLERAPFFLGEMGLNPRRWVLRLVVTPTGYRVYGDDTRCEATIAVAFYSHKTGHLRGARP